MKRTRSFAPSQTTSASSSSQNQNCCMESGSPRRLQGELPLKAFLRYVAVMPFDDEASSHYAKIRADLKKQGRMVGGNDLFIAAHARSLDLVLGRKQYPRVLPDRRPGHRELDCPRLTLIPRRQAGVWRTTGYSTSKLRNRKPLDRGSHSSFLHNALHQTNPLGGYLRRNDWRMHRVRRTYRQQRLFHGVEGRY